MYITFIIYILFYTYYTKYLVNIDQLKLCSNLSTFCVSLTSLLQLTMSHLYALSYLGIFCL